MQNSFKEVVKEGQQYVGTESLSFEHLFSINMVFLQESVETYMPICIKLPMYLEKALNQLIEILFNMFKPTEIEVYVYTRIGKRHDFHMIETTEQKNNC